MKRSSVRGLSESSKKKTAAFATISRMVTNGKVREGMLSLKGNIVVLVLILTTAFSVAAAQSRPTYQDAVNALYNLDFNIGEEVFNSLIKQDPDNLEYWNGLASTNLLRILYKQQKFNVDSFSGSRIGTRQSKDVVDPEDEQKLRSLVATVTQKANAAIAKNPKDVRALYALGAANATLASFEGLVRRSYVAAHSKAKQARHYHQQVLKLDPSFHDARLAIGVYDYGVGQIKGMYRLMLGIFGIRGNKEQGIRDLEFAAAKGNNASTDAKLLLVVVYDREKRYTDALRLIDELLARYPRNFQLEMTRASIYGKMKNWDEAVKVYEHIGSKIRSKQDGYERLRQEIVYHEIGQAHVNRLKLNEAIEAFMRVVNGSNSTADEKADSHLWIGKIYDSTGQRAKAVEMYNAALKLDCNEEIKSDAAKYKRTPFK